MFEDANPCDSVLVAQQWLRSITGKTRDALPDPEFLVNRQNGLPEHVVLSIDTLQTLQFFAVKGLLKELNTKVRPEEIATLLNRSNPFASVQTPTGELETEDTPAPAEESSAGFVCLSGLVSRISEFPYVIGHNPTECSLVLSRDQLRNPQTLLPVHCVIDKTGDGYSIECFGACSVDGSPLRTDAVVSLKPGATISVAGAQISFFPSE